MTVDTRPISLNFLYLFFRYTTADGDHNNVSSAFETSAENCVFHDDVSVSDLNNTENKNNKAK